MKNFCAPCPIGCVSCKPTDPSKPFAEIKCENCTSGFYLDDNLKCQPNYAKDKIECKEG